MHFPRSPWRQRSRQKENGGRSAWLKGTFAICLLILTYQSFAQVENVPIDNQVYEFLDRLGVKGIIPLYSGAMIPLSRREVGDLLKRIVPERSRLSAAERSYLEKFEQEFAEEVNPDGQENAAVLFSGGQIGDVFSDKEKYLYRYKDSSVMAYLEFLGSFESRFIDGDTHGRPHVSLEEHGGRIRGTVKNRLGFFLRGTNGTIFGDKNFARSDRRLEGNFKLESAGSTNFDVTEAYLRVDLDWFNFQFGREYTRVGHGYSGTLLLSDQSPVFDFLKIDARYKSFRMVFLHGSIVDDSLAAQSLTPDQRMEFSNTTKYIALHRFQLSLLNRLNIGLSEMTIYHRASPEFAYLNPINFYKSAEHSMRDRDNAILNVDLEVFPLAGYKFYGTWLIDDIDFSRIGTGWWGNEFGWQVGVYVAGLAGCADLDGIVEYTRIEPYVYSNRTAGLSYTHNNIGLGHHLDPNSDEWMIRLGYRPSKRLRAWLTYRGIRHGENLFENGALVKNVGGDAIRGHRPEDSEIAPFLDGDLLRRDLVHVHAVYEPFTNLFLSGVYEFRSTHRYAQDKTLRDHYAAMRIHLEY